MFAVPQEIFQDVHGNRDAESGLPFIRNFSPRELNGTDQVWAFVQDGRGVMYFGTGRGLLEYDGVSWRSIRTGAFVRSLAACEDGRVYAGSQSEAGYLAHDAAGQTQFVSLRDKVPAEQRAFGDISSTVCTPEGVYFQSPTHLLRWAGGRMKVWQAPKRFIAFARYVNGRLYVGDRAAGMLQMRGDSLEPVPGFERFAASRRLLLLPYGDDRILVADHGPLDPGQRYDTPFYLYDGKTLTRFPTEADKLLTTGQLLYSGAVLRDGTFALGTLGGGVIIIGRDGRLLRVVDKSSGLRDPSVYSVTADREGSLWLTLSSGIARMEALSPLTYYGPESGLDGNIYSVSRHAGKIYAGTERGVFVLDARPGGRSRFRLVPGAGIDQAFGFASVQDRGSPSRLLVASGSGLHEIRDDRAFAVKVGNAAESFAGRSVVVSKQNQGRVYVGLSDGLGILELRNDVWVEEGRIRLTGVRVLQIIELEGSELWLGTESSGVVRVTFPQARRDGELGPPVVNRFGSEQGLPAGAGYVWRAGGRLIFAFGGLSRLYRFDEGAEKFSPDSTFATAPVALQEEGGDLKESLGFAEDSRGNIWTQRGGEMALMVRQADGSYRTDQHPFLHSTQFGAYNDFFADPDGVIWFAANGGLLRYDPARAGGNPPGYSALIRRVSLSGGSALFDGAGAPAPPRLKAANNALRFEFAAPSYGDESATEFRQYLGGLDKGWSAWSRETRRDFTSLPFGAYDFHVRARNAWGQESSEAAYSFQILPPWYRTWWANALYALTFAAVITGGAGVQRRRLIARERERTRARTEALEAQSASLEKIVDERTAELSAQKGKVEEMLLNILPESVARELQQDGMVQPMYFEDVTIGFTDFVGFSKSTMMMPAEDVVNELNRYFTAFDRIIERYGLEKLKTIGDSYMFASGLPDRRPSNPLDAVLVAMEMVETVQRMGGPAGGAGWKMRVGLHTGPVIAGVVGIRKFAFDVWGETVNFASRMESSGEPNRVNMSERTFARVKDFIAAEHRGRLVTKDGNEADMYFVEGILDSLMADGSACPPPLFERRYRLYFRDRPRSFPEYLVPSPLRIGASSGA